jgi:hypothetical protein
MTPAPQPYYTLQVDVAGCAYDIRMNDAPVYENRRGFPMAAEFPVNRWLRNGENRMSVRVYPVPGRPGLDKEAKCTLTVYRREREAARESRVEEARLEYPGGATRGADDGATIAEAPFTAAVRFGLFRWFTSPDIADNDATLAELVGELERFHGMLEARDLAGLLEAVGERDREDASANYQSLADQQDNSRREYGQFFDDSEYTLRPLIVKNLRLRIYGNGRLARVTLLSNGQSPLYYLTANRQTAGYIGLLFCRSATGKWIIIRS